jgi:tetrahydromethanopterin S-methyltransferase subunit G
MRFLKANWPHILLSLLPTAFALGFAWALLGNRVANAERRLDEIDAAHVVQTRWEVEQHTATLVGTQTDVRKTEAELSQINIRLGVIDAKLDAIAEELKKR